MAKKVVWILGSGFSKSLGGPLLKDLLSDRSGSEARARLKLIAQSSNEIEEMFPSGAGKSEPPDYTWVYAVYAEHLRGSDASRGKSIHWDDAEEFLSFVDSTEIDGVRQAILREWLPEHRRDTESIKVFRKHAVQAIAAECKFVATASVKNDEAWSPYVRWGSSLDARNDTILTFNYDAVLEKLGASKLAAPLSRKGILTLLSPGGESGYVRIYKLHGSVEWFYDQNEEFSKHSDFVQAVNSGLSPLLGTPGISKRRVRDRFLKQLWASAESELRAADVVVFLGYRSPPSDPDARAFILNAISAPEGKDGAPRHRRIHLVLGPNTDDSAITRLNKLIEFSMAAAGRIKRGVPGYSKHQARYEVIKQPLYVEDFLSVYYDNELYGTDPDDDI